VSHPTTSAVNSSKSSPSELVSSESGINSSPSELYALNQAISQVLLSLDALNQALSNTPILLESRRQLAVTILECQVLLGLNSLNFQVLLSFQL
jgi:hypothetical protein